MIDFDITPACLTCGLCRRLKPRTAAFLTGQFPANCAALAADLLVMRTGAAGKERGFPRFCNQTAVGAVCGQNPISLAGFDVKWPLSTRGRTFRRQSHRAICETPRNSRFRGHARPSSCTWSCSEARFSAPQLG